MFVSKTEYTLIITDTLKIFPLEKNKERGKLSYFKESMQSSVA